MAIDFITVTHRQAVTEKLAQSIVLAVGTLAPCNLTIVDGTKYDLFTGYNEGAAQTTGEILAFVHDDVQLLGNPLTMSGPLNYLQNPNVGFVGVAGTQLLPASGCWWGGNVIPEVTAACRGIAGHPMPNEFGLQFNVWPPGAAVFGKVIVLDGVLLMCHRRTFEKLGGFDAEHYTGFHFYDVDITFRAAVAGLTNLAAPIPLLHQSSGIPTEAWETNRQIFVKRFGHLLPASLS